MRLDIDVQVLPGIGTCKIKKKYIAEKIILQGDSFLNWYLKKNLYSFPINFWKIFQIKCGPSEIFIIDRIIRIVTGWPCKYFILSVLFGTYSKCFVGIQNADCKVHSRFALFYQFSCSVFKIFFFIFFLLCFSLRI